MRPTTGKDYKDNFSQSLIHYYQKSHTTREVAEKYCCSTATVRLVLRINNIVLHERKNMTKSIILKNEKKIRNLLANGYTRTEIALLLNVPSGSFMRELNRMNIYLIEHTGSIYQQYAKMILQMKEKDYSYSEIAKKIGGSKSGIGSFCMSYHLKPKLKRFFSKHYKDKNNIIRLRRQGMSDIQIGQKFGVSQTSVRNIAEGKIGGTE